MTTKTIASVGLALILTATAANAEIVKVETAAGTIQVSSTIAPKMQAFVADVVARGFKGRINCYARGGHVHGSRHYSGNACDFAQRGWGKTVAVMYRVADLAAKYGLRDGCTFKDCGHIDDGRPLQRGSSVAALTDMPRERHKSKHAGRIQIASYAVPDRHSTQ